MFGLGSLIGPVANLAGTWLDGHVAEKKARQKLRLLLLNLKLR